MNGQDPNSYTVKDILTQFVLPALDDIKEAQDDDRQRISALESTKNKLVGAMALVAILSPLASGLVTALLLHTN